MSERKITFHVIKEAMSGVLYKLSSMKFMNPDTKSQAEIEGSFQELYDEMQAAFRDLDA